MYLPGVNVTEVDSTAILTGMDSSPATEGRVVSVRCSGFSSVKRITVIRL